MAESSGPFSTTVPWNKDEWYAFAPAWAPSGVLGTFGVSEATQFSLSFSGLTGTITAGKAFVRGSGYVNSSPLVIAVPANVHATNSLFGRFVLRRDLVGAATSIQYKAGFPGVTQPPALTQVEGGVWEEPLWQFTVPAASGTAISGIVDQRAWTDPAGGTRRPTSWTDLALTAPWATYLTSNPLAVSYADSGQVWLRGRIANSAATSANANIATLTVGARPTGPKMVFYVPTSTGALVEVILDSSGNLYAAPAVAASTVLTFDTVAYRI